MVLAIAVNTMGPSLVPQASVAQTTAAVDRKENIK